MSPDVVEVNFVEPSVELITDNPVRKIERAYRVCYRSEDKMSEDSWKLIKKCLYPESGEPHSSPLEHVAITLKFKDTQPSKDQMALYATDFQFSYIEDLTKNCYSGNLRAFWTLACDYGSVEPVAASLGFALCVQFPEIFDVDPNWIMSMRGGAEVALIQAPPTHYTFRVVTSRDILQEFVRHRQLSFSVESTRYCNYLKKGLTFIDTGDKAEIKDAYIQAANSYVHLVGDLHYKPEEARCVLPGGLKTEFFVSGFAESWEHFLDLRLDKASHPGIRLLAEQIETVVRSRGL